jgi:hypothetical protein
MKPPITRSLIPLAALLASACSEPAAPAPAASAASAEPAGLDPKKVADMLHAVMEADRTVYTQEVVNRLVKKELVKIVNPTTNEPEPFKASEQWKTEHGKLPLPAQMFRMGAEKVTEKNVGFTYALLSKWPINAQNKAKTQAETEGLDTVEKSEGKTPYYGAETLGGKNYFTAVYADMAVAPACIDCHNEHQDSPRKDFDLGDVMGGVVIRIPLDS